MAILLLLQGRGKMTARRLATILDVSTRTIYRDIIALSLAHIPVSMEHGPGGGYYLPEDYRIESAIFTREEAISLVLSADMSENVNLFAGDHDLHRALIKLEAALPEEYRCDVEAAREHILLDSSEWYRSNTSPTFLETLRAAVLGKQQLDILYPSSSCAGEGSSNDTVQWRRVEPYGLVLKAVSRRHVRTGRWYLVAYCRACQDFNIFRVSGIEAVHTRPEPVSERPDFNLRAYWLEARKHLEQPLALKLHISPSLRASIQGDVTLVREEQDGSAIVSVEVESLDVALTYVLGLGADVKVLGPPRVRNAVAATANAIAELYG